MIRLLAILTLIVLPSLSLAEETGELILPRITNVSIVHHTYMEPEQFGILMKIPNAVSGCYDVSSIGYKTTFIEKNYLDIEVTGYKRTPIKTKNVSYDCSVGTKVVTATIPLNTNDLRERNIRQIRFKRGVIEDAYNVELLDNAVTLSPVRTTSFKPLGSLTHNISGGGLVKLSVPMLQKGEDVSTLLKNFAYGRALETSDKGSHIFMDQSGETIAKIGENGYAELGTIQVPRPFNNGNGVQMTKAPLKVFASRP